jgi:F-box associated region.
MPTKIEQLKELLEARQDKETGDLLLKALDLENTASSFIALLEMDEILFNGAQICLVYDQLIINGIASVWKQSALTSILTLSFENERWNFVLQSDMPERWTIVQSFPKLEDKLLSALTYKDALLLAASENTVLAENQFCYPKGISFQGKALPEGELIGLKLLFPLLDNILLQGAISVEAESCSIDLSASINLPLTIEPQAIVFHLCSKTGQPTASKTYLAAKTCVDFYQFPVTLDLPSASALDQLEAKWRTRLEAGLLVIEAFDFGEISQLLEEKVFWAPQLRFVDVLLTRKDAVTLILTGKTAIYGLPSDQDISISVSLHENQTFQVNLNLDMQASWKLSDLVHGVKDSFFDTIIWDTVHLVATSTAYSRTEKLIDQEKALVVGLNILGKVSTETGALSCLKMLTNEYSSISLQGSISSAKQGNVVEISGLMQSAIDLQLHGFERVQIVSPAALRLHYNSPLYPPHNLLIAAIAGPIVANGIQFNGLLHLPLVQAYWHLEPDGVLAKDMNCSTILGLIPGISWSTIFPKSLLDMTTIRLSSWETTFIHGDPNFNSTSWQIQFIDHVGTPMSWQILPGLVIDNPGLTLEVLNILQPTYNWGIKLEHVVDSGMQTIIHGNLKITNSKVFAMTITIPAGEVWALQLLASEEHLPSLDDLAQLAWNDEKHSGQNFLSILPQGLIKGPDMQLGSILVTFIPSKVKLVSVAFTIVQNNSWTIIPQILELSDWKVKMQVSVRDNYQITASITGTIHLGNAASFTTAILVAEGQTILEINLDQNKPIQLDQIASLFAISQDSQLGLPTGFDGLTGLTIDELHLKLMPGQDKPVHFFRFNMYGVKKWVVVPNWLEISDVKSRLHIERWGAADYRNKGSISAIVKVGGYRIWIYAGKESYEDAWLFKLALRQSIKLPGLAQLAKWMLPEGLINYIPEALMPFPNGFLIEELELNFNLAHQEIEHVKFVLQNCAVWQIIPKYLSLDQVYIGVRVDVDRDMPDNGTLQAQIQADLQIGGATIRFSGTYDLQKIPHWMLKGELLNSISFDFKELLQTLHIDDTLAVPNYSWLPVLTVKEAQAMLQPEVGIFNASTTIGIDVNWAIPFAGLQLSMIGLSGNVDLRPVDSKEKSNRQISGKLTGLLDFNSLKATFSMVLGNESQDTVFSASLTQQEIAAFNMETFADGISKRDAPTASGSDWDNLRPNGMKAFAFDSIYAYYNYTKSNLFLYGNIQGLGAAIWLSQPLTESTSERGYLFAFALSPDFVFGQLFEPLAVIDHILKIRQASIIINSYKLEAAALIEEQLNKLCSADRLPEAAISPFNQYSLPLGEVPAGVHIYAALDFESNLFSRFLQLRKMEDVADVTIYSRFDKELVQTQFKASIAPFGILDCIELKGRSGKDGIEMSYTAAQLSEFKLSGAVDIQFFGEKYSFDGDLIVNDEKTTFKVTAVLDQEIRLFKEFLPSLFTLTSIKLDLIYHFQTATVPQKYLVSDVIGEVKLIGVPLEAHLYLLGTKPVLAEIILQKDFSIASILTYLIGVDQLWNTKLFNISFLKHEAERPARIYYYDGQEGDLFGQGRLPGYNLEATIELTFIKKLFIKLAVQIVKGQGLKSKVALNQPINLFVLQLAGTALINGAYAGGPIFHLDTTSGEDAQVLGFETGVSFFQVPCTEMKIQVEKYTLKSGPEETFISILITPSRYVEPFGKLSLSVSYSKSRGFAVKGWEKFTIVTQGLDIVEQVKSIMNAAKGECTAFINFITNKIYHSSFTVSPSFRSEENTAQSTLYFVLDGRFSIFLANVSDPVATINFPELMELSIPEGITLEQLPALIVEKLVEGGQSFLKALMQNGEQWAKVAGILFAEQAIQLGTDLLCRQLVSTVTSTAMAAAGTAVATAGTDAAATLLSIAAAAAAAVFSGKDGGGQSGGGGSGEAGSPDAPFVQSFEFMKEPQPAVKICWEKKNDIVYNVQLRYKDEIVNEIKNLNDQLINFPIAYNKSEGRYEAWVQATRADKTSEWRVLFLAVQDAPDQVNLTAVGENLEIQVEGHHTGQEQYHYIIGEIDHPINELLSPDRICSLSSHDWPVGKIPVQVNAVGNNAVPSQYIRLEVIKLDSPPELSMTKENKCLKLSWLLDPVPCRYQIQLQQVSDNHVVAEVGVNCADLFCLFSQDDLANYAGPFMFMGVSKGRETSTLDSILWKTELLIRNAQPVNVASMADVVTDKLSGSWQLGPNQGYLWRIMDVQSGQQLAGGETSKDTSTFTISISQQGIPIGRPLELYVQALPVGQLDLISMETKAAISWIIPDVPTDIQLHFDEQEQLLVAWQYPVATCSFEAQILDGITLKPIYLQPSIYYAGRQALVMTDQMPNGKSYALRLRTTKQKSLNLLLNVDGSEGLDHWEVLENGGDGWGIEKGPGAACFVNSKDSNFVTSYGICRKAQSIDLLKAGFDVVTLDQAPEICVSEWICSRFDCQGKYQMYVELRNNEGKAIAIFDSGWLLAPMEQGGKYPWQAVEHRFKDYKGSLRYVYFEHRGIDSKWWRGRYGSKMTGASVTVVLPSGKNDDVGPWSAPSAPISLGLHVPFLLTANDEGNNIKIAWQSKDNRVDYDVELLIGESPVSPQPEFAVSGTTVLVPKQLLQGAAQYAIRVRSHTKRFVDALINGSAQQGMQGWNIDKNGGNGWQVEEGPASICPAVIGSNNFVSSYALNQKSQTIDLQALGFDQGFLENCPAIAVSEWIISRGDCRGKYRMYVELRDQNGNKIDYFDTGLIEAPVHAGNNGGWLKVFHEFTAYKLPVKFIYFEHSGIDTRYWKGWYGSKMTGARVTVRSQPSNLEMQGEWSKPFLIK